MRRRAFVPALLAAVAAVLPGPGAATVPGRPGLIAYVATTVVPAGTFSVRPDGTGRTRLPWPPAPVTPVLSGDGSSMVWTADDGTLWIAGADGTGARSLGAPDTDPSFSPDGTQLVAVDQQGLSVIDTTTGAAQQITTNEVDVRTWWSPDGAWIAYIGAPGVQGPITPRSALHLVHPDGSDDHVLVRNVDVDNNIVWSPDGTRLAVSTSALRLVDLMGTITTYPDDTITGPVAWSPDGTKIAYGGFGGLCTPHCKEELRVRELADGKLVRLVHDGYAPAWSRDGRTIAYLGHDQALRVINASGGRPKRIADRVSGALTWTTDGRIIYPVPETDVHSIAVVAHSGGIPRLLPGTTNATGQPAWSPDGKRLAFATGSLGQRDGFHAEVEVVDANGAHAHVIRGTSSNVEAPDPSWSPDGRELAYVRDDGVYVVAATGGKPRRIAKGAYPWSPVWSPDGSLIAFGGGIYIDNGHLEVIRPDGSGRRWIRSGLSQDERIDWSPNGRQLALVLPAPRYNDTKLYVVGLDGRPTGIWARGIDNPSWSPDGTQMVGTDPDSTITEIAPDGTRTPLGVTGAFPAWQPSPTATPRAAGS
jgi:Tol biopolymer transport system component